MASTNKCVFLKLKIDLHNRASAWEESANKNCVDFTLQVWLLRKVSVLNWHDCSLPGKNIENPDDCRPFNRSAKPLRKLMLVRMFNKAITKIHKDGYDMSILYIDNLKLAAKRYGPNSNEVMEELANLDEILQVR